MKNKVLTLSNVEVKLNYLTGSIELTSNDARIQKKPFKLKLSKSSSSYNTLYNLLQKENLIDESLFNIRKTNSIDDPKSYRVEDKDPRTNLAIGSGVNDELVRLDLTANPHTLIAGSTASGKSFFLRNVIVHGLNTDEITLYSIFENDNERNLYAYRPKDVVASNEREIFEVLEKAVDELDARLDALGALGVTDYKQLALPAIYLTIDSYSHLLLAQPKSERELVVKLLNRIGRFGRTAGVYLFLTAHYLPTDGQLMFSLSNRILMYRARSDRFYEAKVLEGESGFGSALQTNPGRGVLKTLGGSEKLFQSFHYSYAHLTKTVDKIKP